MTLDLKHWREVVERLRGHALIADDQGYPEVAADLREAASVIEELVAQNRFDQERAAAEALLSASMEREKRLVEALEAYQRVHESVAADLLSAHQGRGNGTTQWMIEDDRELRSDFRACDDLARQALKDQPQ